MGRKLRPNFLGKKLVDDGVITDEQLREALTDQRAQGKEKDLLGKVLVEQGACTEEDVARAVAEQARVPWVSLEEYPIDAAATATLSAEDAEKYKALPVAFRGRKLVVAMRYPTDIVAMDDLRALTGFDIDPIVVTDTDLDLFIERYAHRSMDVTQTDEEEEEPDPEDASGDVVQADVDDVQRPAVQLANMILTQAVRDEASDIHIEAHEGSMRIRFRIDGVLHDVMHPPRRMHASLISRVKIMASMDIAERRLPQDGRMTLNIEGRAIDVRVASLPTSFGERLTLRLLDRGDRLFTLEEMGMASGALAQYEDAINLPYGFILVTGPTGSGKSTTLYASLQAVDSVTKNVITVEDPVERRMDEINQVQINPRAGLTFASGLRSILRCDPDIVMVGEIRDKETAQIAIEAALTGHLVFATLHTNDAAGAVSRLTEMEVEPYLTASSLVCVVAQRLARRLCLHCREPYEMQAAEAEELIGVTPESGEETLQLYRAKEDGCSRCSFTGYRGRIGLYELLSVDEDIQQLTLERRSSNEIKRAATAAGMNTLRQDGMQKLRDGITSVEEMMRVVL